MSNTDLSNLIATLKSYLDEVGALKQLPYNNHEWELWRDKVRDFLALHCGNNSEEFKRFRGSSAFNSLPSKRQGSYVSNIEVYETHLQSIIQLLKMRQDEGQLAELAPDAASSPLSTMHPKIQDVAGSLFTDGHHASAILEAFKAIDSEVKRQSGLSKTGQQLMAAVFNEKSPILRLNELKIQSDKDEQAGFKLLYMGAMSAIRNPYAHDNVPNPNEVRTLEYLSFASLLMRRLEEATRD